MKTWDVKTAITLFGAITLYLIVLGVTGVVLFKIKNEDALINIFTIIFTLFTNVITAVVTYFFTRKSIDSIHTSKKGEQ